ncbi:SRPBCC family protein [Streptomyces lydicus]|uniref:SRPBCC family protein n=1 Tax=Streptomyces lydicus TaxID=47763 RepID=UPI0036FD4282
MLTVEVIETIRCTPEELLAFVLDPERYAQVDRKIRPVRRVRRQDRCTEFAFRPRLAGLPGPETVAQMRLTPGARVDIRLAPPPANRLSRRLCDFEASFVCTPTGDGTRLVRTLTFHFAPWLSRLAEPLLRRRLTAEVAEEVALAKAHLERTA